MKKASQSVPNKLLVFERLQQAWSQKELAEKVGTTTINVSRWERGITFPNAHFRHQLCVLFAKDEIELGLVPSPANKSGTLSLEPIAPDPSSHLQLWHVPFHRNPLFTGREEILISIHRLFHSTKSTAWSQSCVLSGLGGIGKTQIALEYVYLHWQDYQAVVWIDASTHETLTADIAAIANLLPSSEKEEHLPLDSIESMRHWLQTYTDWLLILDNVEDPEVISPLLLAAHNSHILLTTRIQITGMIVSHIAIEPMEVDEGTLFLLRRVKYIDLETPLENAPEAFRVHASYIVQAMGGFALALDQAGAYTEETDCGLSSYLFLYQTQGAALLCRRGRAASHPESLTATLLCSIQKVEQANAVAADLLRICALLDVDVIPEEVIIEKYVSQTANTLTFDTAIAELRKYSLIRRNAHTKTLTLHPLTKAVLRKKYAQSQEGPPDTYSAASSQVHLTNSLNHTSLPDEDMPGPLALPEQDLPLKRGNPAHNLRTLIQLPFQQGSRLFTTKRGILITTSIIAICSILTIILYPLINLNIDQVSQQTGVSSWVKEMAFEAQYFQEKGIGISGGNIIFDTYAGRTDANLKKQAALCLQQDNTSCAVNFMTQAISADSTDGEIQIYNDNLHVLQSGAAYVTIVLGLAIDQDATDLIRARAIMQAASLAQHEVNTEGLLPNNLRLRVLVDNSGANNANVATAAQFIANRVRNGNPDHILAVVGWPFSSQTTNALDVITGARIPMVSQAASSTTLSGSSPYFFRVNPTDNQQGQTLADVAVNQFHARTILLAQDPTDPYSVSLARAFSQQVTALKATVIYSSTDNFTIGITSVNDYQQSIVKEAQNKKVNLIFLAGFDVDAIRLAHALGNAYRANPVNTSLAELKIMSGDAVATGLPLGYGGGLDALIANQFPQDMQRLVFSSFAHPDEWAFEKIPPNQWPSFFSNWFTMYKNISLNAASSFQPGSHAILTYDALQVSIKAINLVPATTTLTGEAVRKALTSLGKGNIPAFQGISGLISFDNQGDPINKAFVLLDIESINHKNTIVLKQVVGLFHK
jgi:ABC-type branched-subunit amino acid transport system substrate-binding protein/transcriptional regulator with XRE-family HTH domain